MITQSARSDFIGPFHSLVSAYLVAQKTLHLLGRNRLRIWARKHPFGAVLDQLHRRDVEWDWIVKFPPSDLLNERKNFVTLWRIRVKQPKIREIDKYMKGHLFNVRGYHGVHYSVGWDWYCVSIYSGSGIEWLIGDVSPGSGSWSIWFSDLNAALNARDARRRRQSLYFRPDRDR